MSAAIKKTSALERIRANIDGDQKCAVVDAWSSADDPFSVYWTPITLADKQKIQKHARGDDQLTTIYTLIFKACDVDGDPLFTLADKNTLMTSIGSRAIETLALEMLGVNDESITPEK